MLDRVRTSIRTFHETADKAFLDTVREDVTQPSHLGSFLLADQDGLIAARPDLIVPLGQAYDLTGKVGIEVTHKRARSSASRTRRHR